MEQIVKDTLVLDTALLAGSLLLSNGAETFRSEESMRMICRAGGYGQSEVVAFTTAIFITLGDDNHTHAELKRISARSVNLSMLDEVNTVSRKLVMGVIGFEEAHSILSDLKNAKKARNNLAFSCLVTALACALFTLVYGGGVFDAAISLICGCGIQLISSFFSKKGAFPFAVSLLGSAFAAIVAVCAASLFSSVSVEMIIVGAIVPLLPGIALTNAIRDAIMGDLVSGASRLTEVMLTAIGIAAGCGMVFSVYVSLGGVI